MGLSHNKPLHATRETHAREGRRYAGKKESDRERSCPR